MNAHFRIILNDVLTVTLQCLPTWVLIPLYFSFNSAPILLSTERYFIVSDL